MVLELKGKRLKRDRAKHKGACVATLLGTLGVQDYKKVKFSGRDISSLAAKGLIIIKTTIIILIVRILENVFCCIKYKFVCLLLVQYWNKDKQLSLDNQFNNRVHCMHRFKCFFQTYAFILFWNTSSKRECIVTSFLFRMLSMGVCLWWQ